MAFLWRFFSKIARSGSAGPAIHYSKHICFEHILEQYEDIYNLLIDGTKIAGVEIPPRRSRREGHHRKVVGQRVSEPEEGFRKDNSAKAPVGNRTDSEKGSA